MLLPPLIEARARLVKKYWLVPSVIFVVLGVTNVNSPEIEP